eukprot:gene38050-51389_t
MHHFDAARSELNLAPQFKLSNNRSDAENFNYKTAVEKVLLGIFSFSNGVVINYDPKSIRPIPYARIIFNGEEKVYDYFSRLTQFPPNTNRKSQSLQHSNVKYKNHLELLLSAMSVSEAEVNEKGLSIQTVLDSTVSNVGVVPVVTFVREPLDRFFHGYCEAVSKLPPTSKGGGDTTTTTATPQSPKDATTKLGSDLVEIMNFKEPFPRTSAILFPMAGTFFEFEIGLIGQYEHMATDLHEIRGAYKISSKQDHRLLTPKEKGGNGGGTGGGGGSSNKDNKNNNKNSNNNNKKVGKSGEDSSSITSAEGGVTNNSVRLREALSSGGPQQQRFIRAICHLLLIDYVCLPMYVLPAECQFLRDARHAAAEALKRKEHVI